MVPFDLCDRCLVRNGTSLEVSQRERFDGVLSAVFHQQVCVTGKEEDGISGHIYLLSWSTVWFCVF